MAKMKHIHVIDGAENCAFDIFAVTEIDFKIIFPDHEQDIEFAEELDSRENIEEICSKSYSCYDRRSDHHSNRNKGCL